MIILSLAAISYMIKICFSKCLDEEELAWDKICNLTSKPSYRYILKLEINDTSYVRLINILYKPGHRNKLKYAYFSLSKETLTDEIKDYICNVNYTISNPAAYVSYLQSQITHLRNSDAIYISRNFKHSRGIVKQAFNNIMFVFSVDFKPSHVCKLKVKSKEVSVSYVGSLSRYYKKVNEREYINYKDDANKPSVDSTFVYNNSGIVMNNTLLFDTNFSRSNDFIPELFPVPPIYQDNSPYYEIPVNYMVNMAGQLLLDIRPLSDSRLSILAHHSLVVKSKKPFKLALDLRYTNGGNKRLVHSVVSWWSPQGDADSLIKLALDYDSNDNHLNILHDFQMISKKSKYQSRDDKMNENDIFVNNTNQKDNVLVNIRIGMQFMFVLRTNVISFHVYPGSCQEIGLVELIICVETELRYARYISKHMSSVKVIPQYLDNPVLICIPTLFFVFMTIVVKLLNIDHRSVAHKDEIERSKKYRNSMIKFTSAMTISSRSSKQ